MMWQSPNWNGQAQAFRMFAIIGIVLLLLLQPDLELQA
jgi:predicted small integral membrane protein